MGALLLSFSLAGAYVLWSQRAANPPPAKPQPSTDGYTIDLNQDISNSAFEEFVSIQGTSADGQPRTIILSTKNISQPVFSTRKNRTSTDASSDQDDAENDGKRLMPGSKALSTPILEGIFRDLENSAGLGSVPSSGPALNSTTDTLKSDTPHPSPVMSSSKSGPVFQSSLPLKP